MESSYLIHWGFKKGSKKKDHKYIARVEENGKYRYFYTVKEYAAYLKENKEKIASDKINQAVDKVGSAYDKLINDNEYITNDKTYGVKIERVKNSKEWKNITRTKDPEYSKYNQETKEWEYDVDSYLAKKKHPVLDVIDDITNGRKVTINKIDKKSVAAGLLDYAQTYVGLTAIGNMAALEGVKIKQGSYRDEKEHAKEVYNNSVNELNNATSVGQAAANAALDQIGSYPTDINSVINVALDNGLIDQSQYKSLQKELADMSKRR